MRDFSLHILDLIENSVRAGASAVTVSIREDSDRDLLEIAVEDNGPGLPVEPEKAADPFYTTKSGKRTGLGLSLFRESVESAGGRLALAEPEGGGLRVTGSMRLGHVDRKPLGDIAATLATVAWTNPDLDLTLRVQSGGRETRIRLSDVRSRAEADADALAVSGQFADAAGAALRALRARADHLVASGT